MRAPLGPQCCAHRLPPPPGRCKSYHNEESTGKIEIVGGDSLEELAGRNVLIVEVGSVPLRLFCGPPRLRHDKPLTPCRPDFSLAPLSPPSLLLHD